MKIFAMLVALIVSMPITAHSETGPFGLDWGMKESELRRKGIKLTKIPSSDNSISVFKTKSLPSNLSIAGSYTLIFDRKFQFQQATLISKEISGDIYGVKGKEIFADLKNKLIKKYGEPKNQLETSGNELYRETDEFYECLAYDGCGMWVAIFEDKTQGGGIALALKGLTRGVGYIELTYEGPKWSDVMDAIEAEKSKSDAEAL